MPNWCSNVLRGPKELLETFLSKDDNGEAYLDFNKIIPMPEHQPDLTKPNPFWRKDLGSKESKQLPGDMNWYSWAPRHWGTKWNACDSHIALDDGSISFNTAWSPPEPIFNYLMEKYPEHNWSLEYEEDGMCFRGRLEYDADTECVSEINLGWHYDNTPDECPKCKCEYMYTGDGDDTHVIKRCEECGHEVILDSSGKIILQGEEGTVWDTLQTLMEASK